MERKGVDAFTAGDTGDLGFTVEEQLVLAE